MKNNKLLQEILSVLTEPKTRNELKEILKLEADTMKNQTLSEILKNDDEYQIQLKEVRDVMERYKQAEFSEDQREIVDTIVARIDELYLDNAADGYLAGLLDGHQILKNFGLTKE